MATLGKELKQSESSLAAAKPRDLLSANYFKSFASLPTSSIRIAVSQTACLKSIGTILQQA